ncbi:MAG: hypothetical protein ACR2OR_02250 [Hyphomicrobiales bacterium]
MALGFRKNLVTIALAGMSCVVIAVAPAHASDGHWIGLVHEETESIECSAYADAAIQGSVRQSRFYGWAQIGPTWHRVTGRINTQGVVSGFVTSADALDPENTPNYSQSALSFKMQINGGTAKGNWTAPDGCSGEITAYRP